MRNCKTPKLANGQPQRSMRMRCGWDHHRGDVLAPAVNVVAAAERCGCLRRVGDVVGSWSHAVNVLGANGAPGDHLFSCCGRLYVRPASINPASRSRSLAPREPEGWPPMPETWTDGRPGACRAGHRFLAQLNIPSMELDIGETQMNPVQLMNK
jgi:hypothetical protein